MPIDPLGLEEIAFGYSQLLKETWEEKVPQGWRMQAAMPGKPIYAMGSLMRTVAIAPVYPKGMKFL